MKASVIIPHRNSQATLSQALESVRLASAGLEVEIIAVEDVEGRGPSWARNRGLERARGDVVFFVDADDEVEAEFITLPLEALRQSCADMCFFTYEGGPALQAETVSGNAAVREKYLPAFFGYSFDDVRRWNSLGCLGARKQLGQVWRCAYKREFLDRHAIRFDESMSFYEDAAFLSNCVAFSEKTVSIPCSLYRYKPRPGGNLASGSGSRRHWQYKFAVKDFRERLDAACGGEIWKYCEASCVLTLLEMASLGLRAGLPPGEWLSGLWRYAGDPRVRRALRDFPLSWRHPAAAAGVLIWRLVAR